MKTNRNSAVGYMNQPGDDTGNLYMVPTVGKVGESTLVKLSQIKPNEMWYDMLGDWLGTIQLGGEEDATYGFDGEIWYDQNTGLDASNVEIEINHGLIVYTAMGAELTFSGEVLKGDSELFTSDTGNAYTGNFTPVEIKLGDLVPDDMWYDMLGDWLGTISIGGEENFTFGYDGTDWYLMGSTSGDECYDKDGQLIEEGGNANNFPIAAGQGLIVYSAMGASVSLPGAID